MRDVERGTPDLELRSGVIEEPAEIALAALKIRQHLAPGIVELGRQTRAEPPSELDLKTVVLRERIVADDIADEGIGVGIEIACRKSGAVSLASLSGKEESAVGRQKAADILSDLTVPNPVLYAPRLQESTETESREYLQGFTRGEDVRWPRGFVGRA